MITVWQRDTKKGVQQTKLEKWHSGRSTAWIDCIKPTAEDFQALADCFNVPLIQLKNSINVNKRPRVLSFDKYSLMTFRGANYKQNHRSKTAVVGIFLFKHAVLTIHDNYVQGFDSIRTLPLEQQLLIFKRDPPYFVYRLMDSVIYGFFQLMEHVEEEIDKIENYVLQQPSKIITQKIFIQKRTLIFTHKALAANRDVVSAIEKHYIREFKKDDLRHFRDLYNDVAQLLDLVSTYRDILTSILDMYLSSVSNNLNKIMKTLTLLSAFVMVPTLISGIYGMNFRHMPELMWQFGYAFSLGLMVFSVLIFYFYFKRRGWIGWP
jgi:magnesium transporter